MVSTRMTARFAQLASRSPFARMQLRTFAASSSQWNKDQLTNPPKGNPIVSGRGPPEAPAAEKENLRDNLKAATYLGTTKRLPELGLNDRVVLVTGGARGLGLVTAEALCEAGATGEFSSLPGLITRT